MKKSKVVNFFVITITCLVLLSSIVFFVKAFNKNQTVEAKGDTVTANPTLTGTEDTLTGLDINGTAYQIPGGSGNATKYYEHRICSLITIDDGATLQVLTTIITTDSTAYTSLASLPDSVKTRLQNGYPCIVSASDDEDSYRSAAVVYLSGNNVKIEGVVARTAAANDIITASREMTTAVGIDFDTVTEI